MYIIDGKALLSSSTRFITHVAMLSTAGTVDQLYTVLQNVASAKLPSNHESAYTVLLCTTTLKVSTYDYWKSVKINFMYSIYLVMVLSYKHDS